VQHRYIHINPDLSLSIATKKLPPLKTDEVLIKVSGIGINRGDLLQRKGLYPPPLDASPILGLEVSGEIDGTGEKVCALTHGAGYCDYTIVPASQCLAVPNTIDIVSAAGLPEAVFTVWHNVFQRCQLRSGETFLVHGGASGIGTMAIQMACAFGATVYATAGSDEKCKACMQLGAKKAINYKSQDFEKVLNTIEAKGIDVILDMAGGDFIQKNINLAANDGRISSIAFVRGAKAEINFAPVLMKRLTLTASTLRAQSLARKIQMAKEIRALVWPKIESGEIKPVIDSVFAFEEVEKAHQRMNSGEHVGKILLRVNS
jgi:putative PIG3 family NAD(P)H quinone oxidoreductase